MGTAMKLGAVLAAMALAGCGLGQTRLNPLNWFGSAEVEEIERARETAPEQPLIAQVVSLEVERTPSGAIISTVGLPPTQGYWEADLVRQPTEDASVMAFDFAILPPLDPYPAGTRPSREVLGGTVVSNSDLAGIRRIEVRGARNRVSVRR